MPVSNSYAVPSPSTARGRVFYVGDTNATTGITASDTGYGNPSDTTVTYGLDFFYPFATIAYCITNACVAGRGDTIYVVPGTAITISSAAALAISKANITIVGLGTGATRPTVTFTTSTAATLTMTAAGCSFENFIFTGNMNALVSMIVISAADCAIKNCLFNLFTSSNYTLAAILTTSAADRLLLEDNDFLGSGAGAFAGTARHTNAVTLVGGDSIQIRGGRMSGKFSATLGCIQATTATTNLYVGRSARGPIFLANWVTSSNYTIVDTATGSTGLLDGCRHLIDTLSTSPVNGATFTWGYDNAYAQAVGTAMVAV